MTTLHRIYDHWLHHALRYILVLLLLLVGLDLLAITAYATTLTGTIKVNGTPLNGSMTYQLNYPATSGTYLTMPVPTAPIPIWNGQFSSLIVDGNDTLLPRGTYYAFNFYDEYGAAITRLNYVITGSTYDLGAAIPTPILTNNVNFLDLLGIRNLSALNASFQSVSYGPTTINASGITNAPSIMGVLYSSSYYFLHPSSTTCGIQEAEAALPASGGIVVLQSGPCNISTTITLTKPTALIGFGSSSTSLTETSPLPLLQATTALSGIYLHGFTLIGASSSGDLLQLGPSTGTLSGVVVDSVVLQSSGAAGIDVVGATTDIRLTNTTITGSVGSGVLVAAPTTLTADGLVSSANGVDGVQVSAAATIHISHSQFSSNTTAGVALAAGTGHTIDTSTFTGSGTQQYGVQVSSALVANTQTLSLRDNTFLTDTVDDVDNVSTAYVLYYPQVSQTATIAGTVEYVIYTPPPPPPYALDQYFTFSSCTISSGSNLSSCNGTVAYSGVSPSFSGFADSSYILTCTAFNSSLSSDFFTINYLSTSGFTYTLTEVMSLGQPGGYTITGMCHAHHN